MQAFIPTLNQMLYLFACIIIGWSVNKIKLLPANADQTISKLLSYVIMPACYGASYIRSEKFRYTF